MSRWSVRKREGRWWVYDDGACLDIFDTLPEAHTEATKQAIVGKLFEPGGLYRMLECHYDALVAFGLWLSEELSGTPLSYEDLEGCLEDWACAE